MRCTHSWDIPEIFINNKIQKNMFKKIGYTVAGVALTLSTGAVAFADTAFGTSTAPGVITGVITDVAVIIGAVVVTILSLYAALVGLGWGIRKFRRYVSGNKF